MTNLPGHLSLRTSTTPYPSQELYHFFQIKCSLNRVRTNCFSLQGKVTVTNPSVMLDSKEVRYVKYSRVFFSMIITQSEKNFHVPFVLLPIKKYFLSVGSAKPNKEISHVTKVIGTLPVPVVKCGYPKPVKSGLCL